MLLPSNSATGNPSNYKRGIPLDMSRLPYFLDITLTFFRCLQSYLISKQKNGFKNKIKLHALLCFALLFWFFLGGGGNLILVFS